MRRDRRSPLARRLRTAAAWALAVGLLAGLSARAEEGAEEEILIVEDDAAPAASEEGEIILLEEDEDPPAKEPRITGALGRLWEAWHVAADSDVVFSLQTVPLDDGPWRTRASVALETWLLPAPNLSFYANGFGRIAIDGTPGAARILPFADVYEAYAKINAGVGSVQLGRLVVPWLRTRGAALSDRLNPPDYRRGPHFPDAAAQRQPQLGGVVRTSLGALSLEGVAFLLHEPTEGSLAASNQGGVRIATYQGALLRSPARLYGLGSVMSRASLFEPGLPLVDTAVLAARAHRRIGDFDLGAGVVWGLDDVPSLRLRPEVARFLATEALIGLGVPAKELPAYPCESAHLPEASCLGGAGALSHARTVSFSADAAWGLGLVILKAEAVAYPNVGGLFGKTALLITPARGLYSQPLGYYGGALAVEGAIGEWISGSLEVFEVLWTDVPAGALLWGVELFSSARKERRNVHRLALAASLSGRLLGERVSWRVRGETGLLQTDVLVGAEVRYRLPILNLYVGALADVFAGLPGSPGWLRQDASSLGVFIGEGI